MLRAGKASPGGARRPAKRLNPGIGGQDRSGSGFRVEDRPRPAPVGRHEHALAGFERLAGLDLERVQTEFVHLAEGGQRRGLLDGTGPGSGVPLCW